MKKEVHNYLNRATIHGLAYFCETNYFERIFWFLSTLIFLGFGISSIISVVNEWSNNPTVIALESTVVPVNEIQFPTITICPDFTPNRWGFIRNILNLLKFECRNDEECKDTEELRKFFGSHPDYPEPIRQDYTNAVLDDFLRKIKNLIPSLRPSSYSTDAIKIIRHSLFDGKNETEFDEIKDYIYTQLKKRLQSRLNNYELFKSFNVTIEKPISELADKVSNTYLVALQSILLSIGIVQAMPLMGQFGTFYSNTEPRLSRAHTWFTDPFVNDIAHDQYFEDIFNILTDSSDLGVSPYDIPAIMDPVSTYIAHQSYPRQFPYTVIKQINKTEPEILKNYQNEIAPDFLKRKNFLGKILSGSQELVMEIMYHSVLRIKPIFKNRFKKLRKLYKNLEKAMKFPLDFGSDHPFFPRWENFKTNEKFPYSFLMAYYGKSFENNPFSQYKDSYSGPIDIKADDILKDLQNKYQHQQFMTVCQQPGSKVQCQNKFKPVLTDNGICYAFNAPSFEESLKDFPYSKMVRRIYEDDHSDPIITNKASGNSYKLYLILDSFKSKVFESLGGSFRISVNQKYDFMNVRDTFIEAETGYVTKIKTTPHQLTSSKGFQELSIKERKCKYSYENNDENSIFRFYSYASCIFECRVKRSRKLCGCTPWNFPHQELLNSTEFELCDGVQSYCFDQAFQDTSSCNCLPDCEKISFNSIENKFSFQIEEECSLNIKKTKEGRGQSKKEYDLNKIISEKIRAMEGEEFLYWKEEIEKNPNSINDLLTRNKYLRNLPEELMHEKCVEYLKNDFAIVSIELSTPHFTRNYRDISVDFGTKIGTLGGNLGLFAGISILSLVELFYWSIKIMVAFIKNKGKKFNERRISRSISQKSQQEI